MTALQPKKKNSFSKQENNSAGETKLNEETFVVQ